MDNIYGSNNPGTRADGDTFSEIPQNRTLFLEQLTGEPTLKPEIIHGLQTVQQVFAHYKPKVSVDFEDAEGFIKKETFQFTSIESFSPNSIQAQSAFLKSNVSLKDECLNIITQLRNNKALNAALDAPDTRKSLLDAIHAMIADLKTN